MNNNFEKCLKKENLEEHKNILQSLYNQDRIIDLSHLNRKTCDLGLEHNNNRYIIECKSDSYVNDCIVLELVANYRDKRFRAGFYNVGDENRKELESYVDELLKEEKYRSTAFFDFSENKKYLMSYIAISKDKVNKAYYLLDLVPLSSFIRKNWKQKLLLVNTDDTCVIMVKLKYEDYESYLIHEKKIRTYINLY